MSSFLLIFVASVTCGDGQIPITEGERIEKPHIDKRTFKTLTPETIHCYIKTDTLRSVCCGVDH